MRKHNIYFIGPRASGKTTVGRLTAERLGMDFMDTDHLAAGLAGESIRSLVEREGWDCFRDLEHSALRAVAESPRPTVAATGGGVPLRRDNREIMAKSGIVLYLRTDPSVYLARLAADPEEERRPGLTGRPLAEEVVHVAAERDPVYMECAGHVLDAAASPGDLAAEALRLAEEMLPGIRA